MNVTHEEVIAMMQSRFPKEFEICVLAVQNQKALQQIAELSAVADSDAVDDEDTAG